MLTRPGTATPAPPDSEPAVFNPAQIREFTPQNYDLSHAVGPSLDSIRIKLRKACDKKNKSLTPIQIATNGAGTESQVPFDPFSMSSVAQAISTPQYNPYLEDTNNLTNNGTAYFPAQTTYTAPAQPVSFYARSIHMFLLTLPASIPPLCSHWPTQRRPTSLSKTYS
jgi:PAB-dependent poly(A)-specific ribonuclease subunit 3